MSKHVQVTVLFFAGMLIASSVSAQTREEKVRNDRDKYEKAGYWTYNDLKTGFERVAETGKPLLIVFRCIPCEECVKLDDELIEQDPALRPLLDQFICVRQISTNGLDLSLFQFDTDQSWFVFMLNADGTIYGRYGTRSHRTEWRDDVSVAGLADALRGALELHRDYPANKSALAGKRGQPLEAASPELFPALADKYTDSPGVPGNMVSGCIHCHQIGDAQRDFYWSQNKPVPENILFPWPHPASIGLVVDPETRSTLKDVVESSIGAKGGFQPGDSIESMSGQPILSIADIQWVLHHIAPEGGSIDVEVRRGSEPLKLELELPPGWRRTGDLSWRASSWGLRRMVTGGLVLEPLDPPTRDESGLAGSEMALRVKHVGQYNEHAAAKRAGFQLDDVIVAVDGRSDLFDEESLFLHIISTHQIGDEVPVTVVRDGKRVELKLPVQR